MEDEDRESELVLDLELDTLKPSCEGRPLLLSMGGGVEEEDMFVVVKVGRDQLAQGGTVSSSRSKQRQAASSIEFVGEPCRAVSRPQRRYRKAELLSRARSRYR